MKSRAENPSRIIASTLAVASMVTLAACNTVSGLGTDIEQTSDNTKKAFGGTPDPAPGQTSDSGGAKK